MTDKERRENDALENLIQAAYDFSDEQLLAELEETEATLSDSDFPGIEDRIYQKLMARMAEEDAGVAIEREPEAEASSEPKIDEIPTIEPEVVAKKVVRFGKKKVFVVGILAAAFVGMLGVTAIGGKNYFFRGVEVQKGIVFNNDKNIINLGDLDTAYKKIEEEFEAEVLKLKYVPDGMHFKEVEITEYKALFIFEYNEKVIYFTQEKQFSEASVGINSDRNKVEEKISNEWLGQDIILEEEILDDGNKGYAISLNVNNIRCRLSGQISKEEMINIAKYLNF